MFWFYYFFQLGLTMWVVTAKGDNTESRALLPPGQDGPQNSWGNEGPQTSVLFFLHSIGIEFWQFEANVLFCCCWVLVCCSVLLISWLAELWVAPASTSSIINEWGMYKNWRTRWITSQEPHTVQPAWIWATVYCPDKDFLCLPSRMVPPSSTPETDFPHYEITCPCGLPHYPDLFIYPDHRTPNFTHTSPVDSTFKSDFVEHSFANVYWWEHYYKPNR